MTRAERLSVTLCVAFLLVVGIVTVAMSAAGHTPSFISCDVADGAESVCIEETR